MKIYRPATGWRAGAARYMSPPPLHNHSTTAGIYGQFTKEVADSYASH